MLPRADGPFKVLERINDNAYKLELPADFGVSPTFNITDLKPYMGEENECESRTTQMQEGEHDEDIPSLDTTIPIAQQGPMTRAKALELNYQVKSFLAVQTISSPDGVLLNPCDDFLMLRKMERTSLVQGYQENHQADAGVNNKKTILNIRSACLDIVAALD